MLKIANKATAVFVAAVIYPVNSIAKPIWELRLQKKEELRHVIDDTEVPRIRYEQPVEVVFVVRTSFVKAKMLAKTAKAAISTREKDVQDVTSVV